MGHSRPMIGGFKSALFRRTGMGVAAFAFLALAACGGGPAPVRSLPSGALSGPAPFAAGLIQSACKANHRTRASSARCGCVQAAANMTLSPDQQRRGAGFFHDPEALQRMKLSDSAANERFWESWARFAETAEAICHGT
ncbi:MAG: hypothetical protein AAF999_16795 [Pseudomonadota bacterium]